MRVAINGFGRIGRCVLRALLARGNGIELVAINDPGDRGALLHLLQYDSVHGRLQHELQLEHDVLSVAGRRIQLLAEREREALPWGEERVDLVLECSGLCRSRDDAAAHLEAGAGRVLASAPLQRADITAVFGVNHHSIAPRHRVVSNASCTTNCLAVIAKVLQQRFGIRCGQMTTVHAYTNEQHLVDTAASDLFRARAGALSMIPTKTGAAAALGQVLPELAGRLDGMAVRVPTANVSLLDLHCTLERPASEAEVHAAMSEAAAGELAGVLACSEAPLVSVDFCHHPASAIYDANHTRVVGSQLKLMAWYDNEWGFASRMVDMTHHLAHIAV